MRIAPSPTTVAAQVRDVMHDLAGNDLVSDLRNKRQILGGNKKIDGVTIDLESVFVDNFVPGTAQNGVDGIAFFVTAIEDFRRNMFFLLLRKPLKSGLQHVHIGYPIRTRTVPSDASAAWIAMPSCLFPVAVVTACFAAWSQ